MRGRVGIAAPPAVAIAQSLAVWLSPVRPFAINLLQKAARTRLGARLCVPRSLASFVHSSFGGVVTGMAAPAPAKDAGADGNKESGAAGAAAAEGPREVKEGKARVHVPDGNEVFYNKCANRNI